MCGRYSITTAPEAIRRLFAVSDLINLEPRYNMAPMQSAPVVRIRDDARHLDMLRWGLVPSWAKDETKATSLINARSETADEKPSFRDAFAKRRCLVPADGFYEWQKRGAAKQPYRVCLEGGRPFAFAGLWERWKTPEGGALETFAILTVDADPRIAAIHDRMPAMLVAEDEFALWLEGPPEQAKRILKPYGGAGLEAYEVSTRVGNVRNDDADLVRPLAAPEPQQPAAPKPLRQGSLF